MIASHKLIKDLLPAHLFKKYEETEYPFNLSILHTALISKLEEDPDYEVWAPLVYYKYEKFLTKRSFIFKPHKVFISNKGRICSLRKKKPAILSPFIPDDNYPRIALKSARIEESIVIHRAVACSFIAPIEEVAGRHPKDLQVNHLNGDKLDYSFSNLEWCTDQRNIEHAFEIGLSKNTAGEFNSLTKPIKGEVVLGRYKGLKFILFGRAEFVTLGFKQPNISACCAGRLQKHRGCKFTFATKEDVETYQRGINEEVANDLAKQNPLTKIQRQITPQ